MNTSKNKIKKTFRISETANTILSNDASKKQMSEAAYVEKLIITANEKQAVKMPSISEIFELQENLNTLKNRIVPHSNEELKFHAIQSEINRWKNIINERIPGTCQ